MRFPSLRQANQLQQSYCKISDVDCELGKDKQPNPYKLNKKEGRKEGRKEGIKKKERKERNEKKNTAIDVIRFQRHEF